MESSGSGMGIIKEVDMALTKKSVACKEARKQREYLDDLKEKECNARIEGYLAELRESEDDFNRCIEEAIAKGRSDSFTITLPRKFKSSYRLGYFDDDYRYYLRHAEDYLAVAEQYFAEAGYAIEYLHMEDASPFFGIGYTYKLVISVQMCPAKKGRKK